MKRKALGKGLSSLIPEAPPKARREAPAKADPGSATPVPLLRLDIEKIRPNPRQPRRDFHEQDLEALARSLKETGMLQPIVVRPAGDGVYQIVAGERRWRAAQRAGLHQVPAMVQTFDDRGLLEAALVENLQRADLNPLEEAEAYRSLVEEFGLTQEQVARRVGRDRATVANLLRLLSLSAEVQDLVRRGELAMGHARALASLDDPHAQVGLAKEIVSKGLSVRETERRVRRSSSTPGRGSAGKEAATDPNVAAAEAQLRQALGTKVRIQASRKGGGRIEIFAYSLEEMNRVYELLLRAARSTAPKA